MPMKAHDNVLIFYKNIYLHIILKKLKIILLSIAIPNLPMMEVVMLWKNNDRAFWWR